MDNEIRVKFIDDGRAIVQPEVFAMLDKRAQRNRCLWHDGRTRLVLSASPVDVCLPSVDRKHHRLENQQRASNGSKSALT
jgi:hypothetical protein